MPPKVVVVVVVPPNVVVVVPPKVVVVVPGGFTITEVLCSAAELPLSTIILAVYVPAGV